MLRTALSVVDSHILRVCTNNECVLVIKVHFITTFPSGPRLNIMVLQSLELLQGIPKAGNITQCRAKSV